jgi:hypothetical protein
LDVHSSAEKAIAPGSVIADLPAVVAATIKSRRLPRLGLPTVPIETMFDMFLFATPESKYVLVPLKSVAVGLARIATRNGIITLTLVVVLTHPEPAPPTWK